MEIFLLLLITLGAAICSLGICNATSTISCHGNEGQALLSFKYGLTDPSNRLASWIEGGNCCDWYGAVCHNLTGHVLELRLRNPIPFPSSDYDVEGHKGYKRMALGGKINTSLLGLKHLRYLDLSNNNFGGIQIPKFFGSILSLRYLNLSFAGFGGEVPYQLGNLTYLNYLDLSYNHNLHGKIPTSWRNMCNLQWVALSGLKLKQKTSEALNAFVGCASNSLQYLSLSNCELSGHLLDEIQQFQNLKQLDLSINSISGSIPMSLGSLFSLIELDLSGNRFSGTLSEVFFDNLTRLQVLSASQNSITFQPSPDWIPSFQLREMRLSSWNLGPEFPRWLSSQNLLHYLDISNASIEDTIPHWFWKMSSYFYYMNLSHNQLYGRVSDKINMADGEKFYLVAMIDLISNCFMGPLPRLSSNISKLDLSHNSFSGPLSRLLCDEINETKMLGFLHLGNNKLSGEIPDCWNSWPFIYSLELQNNNLVGNLPSSMGFLSQLQYLRLCNNTLSGVLPSSLQNCTKLVALDLGANKLGGSIPKWIGQKLLHIKILILHSNDFDGYIPNEICTLTSLIILDLADNNLFGTIPKCFSNFSAMAILSSFEFQFTFNTYGAETIWGYVEIAILLVTKTLTLEYSNNLYLMAAIDLSNNNLSGWIPEGITNLIHLISLNLSRNCLTGKISKNMGNLTSLESLDLSFNQISGEIPRSMAQMTFLGFLNLSYNNLSGRIPTSTQLQGFNTSSFIGNNLCGPPISNNCNTTNGSMSSQQIQDRNHHRFDEFYVSMSLGFVVGLGVVVGPLFYSRSWRFTYFLWLESICNGLWIQAILVIRAGFGEQVI